MGTYFRSSIFCHFFPREFNKLTYTRERMLDSIYQMTLNLLKSILGVITQEFN